VNTCAVFTRGSVTSCSEREVAVLSIVVYSSDFLKMSKQPPLESFNIELFINEIQQLPDIWESSSSSYRN
jgi:hypothetical protein